MSFAATLGLVALVQIGMPRLFATPTVSTTPGRTLGRARTRTLMLRRWVAGFATAVLAFHFHRVAPYGVLANLARAGGLRAGDARGISGLSGDAVRCDGFFWWLMGIGIDWMIVVSRWVANLSRALAAWRRSASAR